MRPFCASVALLVLPWLAGCGAGGTQAPPQVATELPAFAKGLTHTYFPVVPGRVLVYEGLQDGAPSLEEVRTLGAYRDIQGVACTPIEERHFVEGVLVNLTTEWFAQDTRGNVWKFGEECFDSDGSSLQPSPESWVAGEAGATPWLAFPAVPRVGDRLVGHSPTGSITHQIVALDGVAVVPAGTFFGCVEIHENPQDPADRDVILYAPGVGRVLERSTSGHAMLVPAR